MRSLRILAGVAILALAAPLVGRANAANAASLYYQIRACRPLSWPTTMDSACVYISGWLGGQFQRTSEVVARGYIVGGIRYWSETYSDFYSDSYGQDTISGTVQITPTVPSSPRYVVTLAVTFTPYPGGTTRIVGRGVIDGRSQKLVGGAFVLTIPGWIDTFSSPPPYDSPQWVGGSNGTMTETIHVPANASVALGRL